MLEFFSLDSLSSLLQVIAIDVALAGDNALVVGMAAAALPLAQRRRAIVIGIAAAAVLRIIFAIFTLQLLKVVGLLLAGGLLLLWVSWKLWREIKMHEAEESEQEAAATGEKALPPPSPRSSSPTCPCRWTTFWRWPVPPATTRW